MRIFTSYFGNAKNLQDKVLVSIANSTPFDGPVIAKQSWLSIVPDWTTIVRPIKWKQIDEAEYIVRYMKQLQQVDVCRLLNWFESISHGKDIVLLCYETPDKFCHRHVFAHWLSLECANANIELETIEEI